MDPEIIDCEQAADGTFRPVRGSGGSARPRARRAPRGATGHGTEPPTRTLLVPRTRSRQASTMKSRPIDLNALAARAMLRGAKAAARMPRRTSLGDRLIYGVCEAALDFLRPFVTR